MLDNGMTWLGWLLLTAAAFLGAAALRDLAWLALVLVSFAAAGFLVVDEALVVEAFLAGAFCIDS